MPSLKQARKCAKIMHPMDVSLGINTGFAINRFPEPEEWVRIVAEELGLDRVQFTADLLNPFLPEQIVNRDLEKIRTLCNRFGVRVETAFTSAFTRVNHVLHPDPDTQRVWIDWFKRFQRIARDLGAVGVGGHFGILTVRDNADPARREQRIEQGVRAWRELAEHGAEIGLEYLLAEPMSIPRELAQTIPATEDLLRRCAEEFAIPLRLCLDVDHGDIESKDPRDTDPHAWIQRFGAIAPCIHIKQSLEDKGGHYPFTAEYNARGRIRPEEILDSMERSGVTRCTLLLEISHRERWPTDYTVVSDLKESVEYWRPAIEQRTRRVLTHPEGEEQ